jgi:putative membrane protein
MTRLSFVFGAFLLVQCLHTCSVAMGQNTPPPPPRTQHTSAPALQLAPWTGDFGANKILFAFAGHNAGPGRVHSLREEAAKKGSIPRSGSITWRSSLPQESAWKQAPTSQTRERSVEEAAPHPMQHDTARQSAEQQADPRVDLAVLRSELAEDRTLLAWVRTAIAPIGAGVAFDKGTQLFHQDRLLSGTACVRGGHVAGLTITVSLLLSFVMIQHLSQSSALARLKGVAPPRFLPTAFASFLVMLFGVVVLVVLFISN